MTRRRRHLSEYGYSLVEMLTVIAIIGVLALVTVPSFVTMRNSSRMKAAMRNFTNDLRAARQLAISRAREVRVSYNTGTTRRDYNLWEADRAYGTVPDDKWTALTGAASNPHQETKLLDAIVYFPPDSPTTPQTFTDTNVTPDGTLDVIFFPDGRAQMPGNATAGTISIKTDMNIPKQSYAVQISPSGRIYVP